MNSKVITIFIVGIILGSCVGFLGNHLINAPTINSLNIKINELQTSLSSLNVTYKSLEATYNSLKSQEEKLSQDYNSLQTSYSNLDTQYNSLQTSYTNLNSQYTSLNQQKIQLQKSYDEMLTKYQTLLASIPVDTTFTGKTISKTYNWTYRGSTWSISLNLPESLYNYYRNLTRPPTRNYSVYVTHPYDDEYLSVLIEKFNLIAITTGLTEAEKINLVISFVQSLPYTVDIVTTSFNEYPRYPIETLMDDGGDCEDTSILTTALLRTMNYDVILVSPPQHMAVGVNIPGVYGSYYLLNSKKYFYLETTGNGWKIGEIPDDYKGASAYLYELKPIPILTHTWISKWSGNSLVLTITIKNVGSATATGYHVSAGFDAGGDKWRNYQSSNSFDIAVGRELILTMTLTPTSGYYTRLLVYIVGPDGYYVDKSNSNWFNV